MGGFWEGAFHDADKKIKQLEAELATFDRDRLAEVEAAARIIFDVTFVSPNKTCPHGIAPSYSTTHAWWCDKCWWRLGTALGVQDAPMDRQEYLKRLHEQLTQDDSVQDE